MLLKYTDDTNLPVPANTDVELADEFRHIMQWTDDNKIINQCKTKEVVVQRPNPRRIHMFRSADDVEVVACTNLLEVWIVDYLGADLHVDYILSLYSQRIFQRCHYIITVQHVSAYTVVRAIPPVNGR